MTLTIPGNVVAKKNSQRVVCFGNRYAIRPSKAYDAYSKGSIANLIGHEKWGGKYPVVVEMFFYRKTLAKFDLDNMQGSILDILVNGGVLEDDSMKYVIPKIRGLGWTLDRENPRTEVKIYEYIK